MNQEGTHSERDRVLKRDGKPVAFVIWQEAGREYKAEIIEIDEAKG